jgi:threonine-phosphate decarboxylase
MAVMTPVHGGDVEAVAREYGVNVAELIDFSASINPLGPPRSVMERLQRDTADGVALARYPDPKYSELRSALAAHLDVSPDCLVIANGSAALFGAVIQSIRPRTCLLPTPAFGQQRHALDAAACEIERFPLSATEGFRLDTSAVCRAMAKLGPSLCVLTNPHNPSGSLTPVAEMSQVVQTAADCRVQLLIDEAFIDFAPGQTLTALAAASDHLVVLRSLTKFYGMPALRVGVAVATPERAARVEAQLPAWPVTTLAAAAAVAAIRDHDYARQTLQAVDDDRRRLRDRLRQIGIDTFDSAGNFLLLRLPPRAPDSTQLQTQLIRRCRIVVRDCRSFDGMADGRFIRVGVRTAADNERLVEGLRSALQEMHRVD